MVDISSSGSGEGPGQGNRPAYSTTVFYLHPLRSSTLKTPFGVPASLTSSSCLPQRYAARRGAVMGGLDMEIRMGDAEDSRVSRCEGLGTARPWEKRGE